MSEGKLKERQLERLMLLYKNTKMPVFLNLARNVEADIDEAKKDFEPFFNFRKYLLTQTSVHNKDTVNEAYRNFAAEVITKLKKWFGETL